MQSEDGLYFYASLATRMAGGDKYAERRRSVIVHES